jgi:hypothetical protein
MLYAIPPVVKILKRLRLTYTVGYTQMICQIPGATPSSIHICLASQTGTTP